MQDINSRGNGGQGRMKGYMGTFSVFNSFFCKPEVRKIKSVNLIFFFTLTLCGNELIDSQRPFSKPLS